MKQNRFDKARHLSDMNMVKPLSVDSKGRIKNALVPGSEAKTYDVVVWRQDSNNEIKVECFLDLGANGQVLCKGGRYTVCYHMLGVLLQSASDNGMNAAICKTEENAEMRKRIGGKVYTIRSKHALDNPIYMVVNTKKSKAKLDEQLKELGYEVEDE